MTPVQVDSLSYSYGKRRALHQVSFSVSESELFALVGPNGGGKSTLFRILSTLQGLQEEGNVRLLGFSLSERKNLVAIRNGIGVVFQSPALDKKLTVTENLIFQGHLYGLTGAGLLARIREVLSLLGVGDRATDKVETLSGGLKRRVEIAKALLHWPKLLILDEPTTGLDPLARKEVWNYLHSLRTQAQLTICLTTHLLEEAESANRVALLDKGSLVAMGTPVELRAMVGTDVISMKTNTPAILKGEIEKRFQTSVEIVGGEVRIRKTEAHEFIPALVGAFSEKIHSVTVGKPTLEDLFILKTGHHYHEVTQ
jgi:ABC-2 type transport system ATP-binding protein